MKKLAPVIIALGVLALGFVAWKLFGSGAAVEGGATNADLTKEIPKAKEGSPDFGPLPDQYIIGKNPGGPTTPGGNPTAVKGGAPK